MPRKLAAILSADVAGFSRLMGEDEAATVRTLTTCRDLVAAVVSKHRGRVVDMPALPPGLLYVEVSAGYWHSVALRSDGRVVAWGINNNGECNVPALPPGLAYVEVAAGGWHNVALRSDGSVVAWGGNTGGQCNVPALPPGLTYVEVAAGSEAAAARNVAATAAAGIAGRRYRIARLTP